MRTRTLQLAAMIGASVLAIACASRTEAPVEADEQKEAVPPAVAQSTPSTANLVRGRVVDASTGQGLPFIKVWLYESGENAGEAWLTDVDGNFEIPRNGNRLRLRFRDALTNKYLGGMPVPAPAGEVVFEAEVGPTLIVRVSEVPEERLQWLVRLIEPGRSPYSGGWTRPAKQTVLWPELPQSYGLEPPLPVLAERAQPGAWSWLTPRFLERNGVIVARYAKQELTPTSGQKLRIQIVESEEVWQGEREIESASGVISAEIAVAPVCVRLSGRVVDEDGSPVRADVVAIPRGPRDSSSPARVASTSFDGEWRMKDLAWGPTRLLVFSENRSVQRTDVELALGVETPLEIVLPRAPSATDVSGALVSPAQGEDPEGIVCLEPVAQNSAWTPRPWVQAKLSTAGRALFAFEAVPMGDHRVDLLALDGRSYFPPSARVTEGSYVEFTTQDSGAARPWTRYDLSLRDSVSKLELHSGSFLLSIAPYWCGKVIHGDPLQSLVRLGEDAPVALLVGHPGYRPTLLRLSEALRTARREEERVDVVLELERGHGAGLIVLDAEHAPRACLGPPARGDWAHVSRWSWSRLDEFLPMRGLQGAQIISQGQVVGTSDEFGLALCASDQPIRRFEVELDGWTLVDVQGFRGDEEVSPCLGYVLMVRD